MSYNLDNHLDKIFLTQTQTMKPQFNEYYQCSSSGYIKHENVPIGHLPMIHQIPIASRCNEILPYKLHKIEVKQPESLSSPRELRQPTVPMLQIPSTDIKRQAPLSYSFSASLMQDPSKILEKDEVHSIHLEDKSNSTRIKTVQNSIDLTKSTYSTSRKHSPDMKRSLFSTNNSVLTHYTISKQKQNQKIQIIANQLKKEREKREEFEKKYEILFNLVNRAEEAQETVTLKEPSEDEQKYVKNDEEAPKKKKKKTNKKKNYVRSNTQSSEQSEEERPILLGSKKSQRKGSSPSPIVINIGSQMLQKSPNKRKHKGAVLTQNATQNPSQNEQEQHDNIKQSFNDIKREVQILNENVGYLEKKLDQQEMRHQKEMLMNELKEKERKIEEVQKENQKMKEINDLLINRRVQPVQNQQVSFLGINLERNSIGASFIMSFLAILLVLNLKNAIC